VSLTSGLLLNSAFGLSSSYLKLDYGLRSLYKSDGGTVRTFPGSAFAPQLGYPSENSYLMARDGIDSRSPLQAEAKRNFENQIVLSPSSHNASVALGARTRVLRASDVLLSLAGKTENGSSKSAPVNYQSLDKSNILRRESVEIVEDSPGVESFAETVRLFPPLRNDDGGPNGAADSKCPDCDAVFSSPYGR
jgi:hypothetical protein